MQCALAVYVEMASACGSHYAKRHSTRSKLPLSVSRRRLLQILLLTKT